MRVETSLWVAFVSLLDLIGVLGAGGLQGGFGRGDMAPWFTVRRASGPPRCGGRAQPLGKPRQRRCGRGLRRLVRSEASWTWCNLIRFSAWPAGAVEGLRDVVGRTGVDAGGDEADIEPLCSDSIEDINRMS
jgi:hypothetical protein